MMKRKGRSLQNMAALKWHLLAFILFTLLVAYSLLSEITYAGNATVPFAVFRPVIIERLSLLLLWGTLLLVHYGYHQLRSVQEQRAYRSHLNSINTLNHDTRRLETPEADEVAWYEDDDSGEKRKYR
jgi:hypothetical protein